MTFTLSNPYYRQDFFGFFALLCKRLFGHLRGESAVTDIATDELQILVLMGIAISASLVGTFLMLRHMTMLANSLAHTILLGIVIVYIFAQTGNSDSSQPLHEQAPIPTYRLLCAALIMGIITTYLTELLTSVIRLQVDAANGLVFTSLFALGVILVTLFTRNMHIGAEVVMGNVNLLHISDLKLVLSVLLINLLSFFLFYKEFQLTTFDPGLARSLGISVVFFNYLLMTQVAATTIGAFRAVGVLMVLSFIVGPPLIARLLTNSLPRLLALSSVIGCLASIVGVALSRHLFSIYRLPLSTAGLVVCVISAFYVLALLFAPQKGIVSQKITNQRLRNRTS